MDPPDYLEEDFSNLDGLEDDVFHSEDCGLAGQPSHEMTFPGLFGQSKSYSCLLGRFQLFPLTHCCGPGSRHTKQQDKATQTLTPSSSSQDVMLPCGVTEEPQRLFYGGIAGNSTGTAYGSSDCTEVTVHSRPVPQASPAEAPAKQKSSLVAGSPLPPSCGLGHGGKQTPCGSEVRLAPPLPGCIRSAGSTAHIQGGDEQVARWT